MVPLRNPIVNLAAWAGLAITLRTVPSQFLVLQPQFGLAVTLSDHRERAVPASRSPAQSLHPGAVPASGRGRISPLAQEATCLRTRLFSASQLRITGAVVVPGVHSSRKWTGQQVSAMRIRGLPLLPTPSTVQSPERGSTGCSLRLPACPLHVGVSLVAQPGAQGRSNPRCHRRRR